MTDDEFKDFLNRLLPRWQARILEPMIVGEGEPVRPLTMDELRWMDRSRWKRDMAWAMLFYYEARRGSRTVDNVELHDIGLVVDPLPGQGEIRD